MKNALLALAIFILLCAFSLRYGVPGLASALLGFFGAGFIIMCSFYGYYKSIKSRLERGEIEASYDELDDEEEALEKEEDIKNFIASCKKKRKFLPSFSLLGSSLLPFRILSYVLFIVVFLVLKRHEMLEFMPLFLGIAAGAFSVVVLARRVYG